MKKFKEHSPLLLLLIVCIGFITYGCMTEEEKIERMKVTHYVDEDFVLVHKEEITDTDGTVRVWKLHRVNSPFDSVYIGEIKSFVQTPEPENTGGCGCGGGDFYITNEMWYNRDIGDVLHFDYIRKNRFFKLAKNKLAEYEKEWNATWTDNSVMEDETPVVSESSDVGYGTDETGGDLDYAERLRLERELEEARERIREIEETLGK